ncbi:MAG: glycosyltransferase family 9 protein [Nitrospinae bacterium]|nr:glycosyltransferase family 9 protein [Nitrospinota bacterium]
MKKILVHNFTRLGDLLQSTPLLMGLKAQDPRCEITLTVHQTFQEICRGFPFVDEVISFDSDRLKEAIVRGGEGLLQGYRYVKSYVQLLKERRFDLVFNLSHSRASCMLLALLDIPQVRGSVADRTGALYTMHPWANYFKNMALHRTIPAFNLVDVYRRMGDVVHSPRRLVYEAPPGAQASVERFLDGMAGEDLLIGFQPGASEDSRQWPVSAFASLGKALCTELGARLIVFGTKKEAPLGEEIVKECHGRAISVMGETSLAELAALLQRCRLLVTNDTGTMHLACAVGTQVVALFMGPALFHQTGPYGAGHVVLQAEIPCAPCNYLVRCSHHVCKEHVRLDAVFQTVKWVVEAFKVQGARFNVQGSTSNGHPLPVPPPSRGRVGVGGHAVLSSPPDLGPGLGGYISGFDEDGYVQFYPLSKRRLDWVTLLRLGYREAWKVVLDGKPLGQALAAAKDDIAAHYVCAGGTDGLEQEPDEILQNFDRLRSLAQQGATLSQDLVHEASGKPWRVGRIQALGKALEELDEQISVLGGTGEELKPFTAMFRFGKQNLQGGELLPLAQQTLQLYETLVRQSEVTSRVLADLHPLSPVANRGR